MEIYSPIKLLRNQLKHLSTMEERLNSKKRELDDQIDMVNWDLNEITEFIDETRGALRELEDKK